MTGRKPVVGISCSTLPGSAWGKWSLGEFMDYLFQDYSRAVEAVGGLPILLPILERPETAEELLSLVDGLVLTGGPDVLPRHYGEDPLIGLGEVDGHRDLIDLALARRALKQGLPTLAICRGIQILAVAGGGTLYQDIPRQVQGAIKHSQDADKGLNTHQVRVVTPSRLLEVLGQEVVWVNSKHHQAVKNLPAGFRIAAQAPDGVVEAMERPDHPFFIGVQWHPEGTWRRDEAARRLFQGLVEAARKV